METPPRALLARYLMAVMDITEQTWQSLNERYIIADAIRSSLLTDPGKPGG